MMDVIAGRPVLDVIALAYQANQPFMLWGPHGIGKSALCEQAARRLGIGFLSLDLSLMEPPDLVGIPRVKKDGRTHYALPAFLPGDGRGLIVFEELNRCPRYMQSPCLQLLTARRLNDYVLPPEWLPCAAVNDASDGYQVDELDAALLSRFLHVKVKPDVREWERWARADGVVHERIAEFVLSSPGVFDDPAANPRAWIYASRILKVWEAGPRSRDVLAASLTGVLGDKWALAFLRTYQDNLSPLQVNEIIEAYPAYRPVMKSWLSAARLDLVAASLELLKRHLQRQAAYAAVIRDEQQKSHVETFFSDLPADFKKQLSAWLSDRRFKDLIIPEKSL